MKGAPITENPAAAATVYAATPDHHGHILKTLLAEANKTIHESLNQTRHAHHEDLRKDHQKGSWTDDQIQTVVYVTLGFLVIICVCIIRYLIYFLELWSIAWKFDNFNSDLT